MARQPLRSRFKRTKSTVKTVLPGIIPTDARVTFDQRLMPLSLPPKVLAASHPIPPLPDELGRRWSAVMELADAQGLWVGVPGFVPPEGRIIDHDFALLLFAEAWLASILERPGEMPRLPVKLYLPLAAKVHPARGSLMSLWGEPFAPGPAWPDQDDAQCRWTTGRLRALHEGGLVNMPTEDIEDGRRSYRADLLQAGLVRAAWIAYRRLAHLPQLPFRTLVDQLRARDGRSN